MKILLTNNTLAGRAGTELYVRDIALRLREAGHTPVCFTLKRGKVAEELIAAGVSVISNLGAAHGPFDLIHGQHRIETTLAAMAFPNVPVLSFCHGPKAWQESPCTMPNVVHYVAVDMACHERLIHEGVKEEDISVILNFADLTRFTPRSKLPVKPQRALVFSNSSYWGGHLEEIKGACAEANLTLDVIGGADGSGNRVPEEILKDYDIVFAKARSAIESMATGCAVIQCDYFGAGRLVTLENFDELRPLNFGYKSMTFPLTVEHLKSQIDAYDADDAMAVSARIRREAGLDEAMQKLLALYEKVAASNVPVFDPWLAAADFLDGEINLAKDARTNLGALAQNQQKMDELKAQLKATEEKCDSLEIQCQEVSQGKDAHRDHWLKSREQVSILKSEKEALKKKLQQASAKKTWWRKFLKP